MLAPGRLKIGAGKVQCIGRDGSAARVTFRPRGGSALETSAAVRIVDCTGINPIPHNTSNPVLGSLFDSAFANVDPLGIGLDSTNDCALIDLSGETVQAHRRDRTFNTRRILGN